MSGLAFLEAMRRRQPDVPVIIVSGIDRARTALEAARLGIVDYVTKPFDPHKVLALVRRVLDGDATNGLGARPLGPLRMLLVTDERAARAALTVVLGQRFRITSAPTVGRAQIEVTSRPVDVLIAHNTTTSADDAEAWRRLKTLAGCPPLFWLRGAPSGGTGIPEVADAVCDDVPSLFRTLGSWRFQRATDAWRFGDVTFGVVRQVAACGTRMTVRDLAGAAGLSTRHLSRRFQHEVGLGIREYLIRVRVEIAKGLLMETSDKVDAVARTAGLYDGKHLARVLRTYGGQTPRQYRPISPP
jgi:AraC-like DNA-binding protein